MIFFNLVDKSLCEMTFILIPNEWHPWHKTITKLIFSFQTRLMNTAESISNKLSYFNELESISSVSWQ
mgnify:CR=1 FL=1